MYKYYHEARDAAKQLTVLYPPRWIVTSTLPQSTPEQCQAALRILEDKKMWKVFVDDTDLPELIGTFSSESAAQACADAY